MDKAIRSAKLTAAGILDKARARTAVTRAGGQIAPSKYLPNVPRQVHADGGKVDFVKDNPGGDWLAKKQSYAFEYPRMKGIDGAITGWMGGKSDLFLPTHVLKSIEPLNNEKRVAGEPRFDDLMSSVSKEGFDPHQKGNKVVVAVNHRGKPFILEGNTRVAVAHAMGVPSVKAEVRYWNGAEEADGPMHPDKVSAMAAPNDPDITKAEGGRIHAEGGGKMELRSRAAEAIRNQPQLKGNVNQLLAVAAKGKGVKQAELANAGQPSGNIISKEELARHFEDAVPKVQVVSPNFPQYEEYSLPEGENYREHLLALDKKLNANWQMRASIIKNLENASSNLNWARRTNISGPDLEKLIAARDRASDEFHNMDRNVPSGDFKSEHWGTPNVLAHLRMDDRDNGKTLHVQEIQSDWGQGGREKGFYDPAKPIEVFHTGTGETVHATDDMDEAKAKAEQLGPQYDYGRQDDEKVPQGPYVGNTQHWTDLAVKHALTEAAKGGHDRVVFSPGEANADLYGQRTPITNARLVWASPEAGYLYTRKKDAKYDSDAIKFQDEKHLNSLLGKQHAKALLAQDGLESSISEPDMHLGGHGMVDYYNNIVHPSALKLLQQHDPSIKPESYDLPNGYKGFGLPMTDTARQSILKNGFGAFKRGGMVGKEGGGSVTDTDEFRNWFGNSVTHTDGDPHVFYHGTSKDKDFTSFNVGRHGAWFTRDPAEASEYAERNDSQGYKQDGWKLTPINTASRVIPAYVKAENPYTGDLPDEVLRSNYKDAQSDWFDTLRRKGHDAWVPARYNGDLVVALKEPQQIKSIFNNGKFDPNQKHMNKAGGGEINGVEGNNQNGALNVGTQIEAGTAPLNPAPRAQAGELRDAGRVRGSGGVLQAPDEAPLEGLLTPVTIPMTGQVIHAGPDPRVRQVARDYMASTGLPYNPPKKYAKADPSRALRISDAYEAMEDNSSDPLTKASYAAMIKETMAQYHAAKNAGFKAEFWNPQTQEDPYHASPRLATEDIRNNNHMFVFPTDSGYGSDGPITEEQIKTNPLLQPSGETWNGIPVTVNDIFRAVHDYFGHAKEGVGFRADGEENAWRSHAAMYSPLARMAMTSETRGQNSWLNFNPASGERNRKARTENSTFADQKVGILPHWVHHEGAEDFMGPEEINAMAAIRKVHERASGGAVDKALSITRRFTKDGTGATMALKSKGK